MGGRKKRVPDSIRVADWNAGPGRDRDEVAKQVRHLIRDTERPEVVTLHEVWLYQAAIVDAISDYQWFRVSREKAGHHKHADTIIGVRGNVKARRVGALIQRLRWTGPKSPTPKNQPGRVWPVVALGRKWLIMSPHKVTGGVGGRNPDAAQEEHDAIIALANSRRARRRALVMPGDWNAPAHSKHKRAPAQVARLIGGKIVQSGGGVDLAVVRDCRGGGMRLGKYGSDHHARLYSLIRGR